jgi:NAD(P)-dependent dehydrogenase (short-subunit alcohol dehydrogenase family)
VNDLHPKRLLGKVVVVTGAARGQGAAEAEALTREGARVIATDVTEAPAAANSTSPTRSTGRSWPPNCGSRMTGCTVWSTTRASPGVPASAK